MVTLSITLSDPKPQFQGYTIVQRWTSRKQCILHLATWRCAGFSAIAEVSCSVCCCVVLSYITIMVIVSILLLSLLVLV